MSFDSEAPLPGRTRSTASSGDLSSFDWGSPSPSPAPVRDDSLPLPSPRRESYDSPSFESSFPTPASSSFDDELGAFDDGFAPVLPSVEQKIRVQSDDDETDFDVDDLLKRMLSMKGSDLHLSARAHPMVRVHGDITPLTDFPRLSGEQIQRIIQDVMTTEQRNRFEEDWELDFAYNLAGYSRFRVNVMKQKREVSVVMRAIPWEIKTVEELGLSETIRDWANLPRGLVLITGPTGSGKSTTLAAIIDHANRTRAGHIVTIEDPIEFVHDHQKSVVNQREIGEDTHSFAEALKHVLRQDPDIILVGEMRDLETISVALTAAETGHLVFGTLHTQSAEDTISRIIDVFPDAAKSHVRTQLAATLQGVACQTLLKKKSGGRLAAVEIMVGTPAVKNLIREGKMQQIQSSLQAGAQFGMQTLDDQLKKYVQEGLVDWREAAEKSTNYDQFVTDLGGEKRLDEMALREQRSREQRGFMI